MATRIKEGLIPYTWWVGIEITDNHVINVLLREMNNLIEVNGDNELYVDLQLPSWIKPTDDFPVGVTTGKILQTDWWQQSGLILNWKTTSGDYFRLIYANDGKLYYDPWTWVWHEFGSGGWGCGCHHELILKPTDITQDNTEIVANVANSGTWTVVNLEFFFSDARLETVSFDGWLTSKTLIYPCWENKGVTWPSTMTRDLFDLTGTSYRCYLTWLVVNDKLYVWDFCAVVQAA